MSEEVRAWTIAGSGGEPIIGNTHMPESDPVGLVLIAHGFKGYKDYGMFPALARGFAGAGFVTHRFNFSHSGMTEEIATFARPDLFEQDTWNRQVEDLAAIGLAIDRAEIEGRGLEAIHFGHSRGGVSVLLAAGRAAVAGAGSGPAGIITAAAPPTCDFLGADDRRRLLGDGYLVSPSSRTGQQLRIGGAFLAEQIADPAGHDLPVLVRRITAPILVVHGENDQTVPVEAAEAIREAAGESCRVVRIAGGDHVFNVANPMPPGASPSPQLEELLDVSTAFALEVVGEAEKRPAGGSRGGA